MLDLDVRAIRRPYTIKRVGRLWVRYHIIFDDTVIMAPVYDKESADTICAALNGAYLLGVSDTRLEYLLKNQRRKKVQL